MFSITGILFVIISFVFIMAVFVILGMFLSPLMLQLEAKGKTRTKNAISIILIAFVVMLMGGVGGIVVAMMFGNRLIVNQTPNTAIQEIATYSANMNTSSIAIVKEKKSHGSSYLICYDTTNKFVDENGNVCHKTIEKWITVSKSDFDALSIGDAYDVVNKRMVY